jgi:hypothetical protein
MVDLPLVIQLVEQRVDDPDPSAVRPPAVEGFEDRLPGAVAFREIAPRGAGMEDPEDAVDDRTGIAKGMPRLPLMSPVGKEGRDPFPLRLGKFIAARGRTRWENDLLWRTTLPIIICIRTSTEQTLVYA